MRLRGIGDPIDRSAMVWVPGGTTVIGSDDFHAEEAPKRHVLVKGFWIDRHEVTNAEFAAFVKATGYRTVNERNGGGAVFRSPEEITSLADVTQWWIFEPKATWLFPHGPAGAPAQQAMPVVQVTYADALAYARWRNRDLPTEVEWERAARGGIVDAEYSWGDQPRPDQPKANTWQGVFPLRDTGGDGYKGVAPVGCFRPNGYGLFDMAGNVWELTSAAWSKESKAQVIKGGSWLCADRFCLRYRPAARQPADGDMGTDHIGFRTVLRAP
jgi:formylglycine-generating enzyme required for sulfatase activity